MTHNLNVSLTVWNAIISRLATMLMVASVAVFYALFLGVAVKKKRPSGVTLLGVLLILGSIYKLWGFLNYEYYRMMFAQLSEKAILLRHFGSVALRLLGLIIATGILLLNNLSRKLFITVSVLTLIFLYFKHPFFVFDNISRHTEQLFFHKTVVTELTYPWRPWVSLVFNYAMDIIFSCSAIYYLTRPQVKEHFH